MNRKALTAITLAVPLVAVLLAGAAQASSADPDTRGKGQPAAVAADQSAQSTKMPSVAPSSALAGYQQVTSPLLTDIAQGETFGSVACPTGTSVVGGGAVISSSSLSENLNSTFPESDGHTWGAYVNNSTTTAGTFRVYANCVKKVAKYAVVGGIGVDNPGATQRTAVVTCPKGTVPLGGGGFASSGSTAVNLNSSIPLAKGWRIDMNNNTTTGNTASAYAVCGKKPAGYAQVVGTPVTVNASSQASAIAVCPSGTLILGGGGFSSSGSTAIDLNSTIPSSPTGWTSWENDGTTSASSLTTYAVCGTAS